jgi:AAA+ superfamily predicted ATPase
MDLIADQVTLPDPDLATAWAAIKLPEEVRERLIAQSLLALRLRQEFPFEAMPVHGLIVLSGPPGTGKTTLARGLAHRVAEALRGAKTSFLQIDPHALASSALGRSQKEVTKLFHQIIPEYAGGGPCIVLLDEVEALAPDRQRMSLEANPIDVHRATDAALAGIDLLTRKQRNVLLVATTNFPQAVDRALMSRADWIEEIGPPGKEARAEILAEVLDHLATVWPRVAALKGQIASFVTASDGLDGRRLRKAIVSAAASSIETASDPNKLKAAHIIAALKRIAKTPTTMEAA